MATVKFGAVKILQRGEPFAEIFGGAYFNLPGDIKTSVLEHVAKITQKVDTAHGHHGAGEFDIHFEGVFVDHALVVQPASATGVKYETVLDYEQALMDAFGALLALGKARHAAKPKAHA